MDATLQKKYLLGVDIGTSNTKTVVIDDKGRLLTWANEEYAISYPHPDWAEQDPRVWLDAVIHSIQMAMTESAIDPRHVVGIGLAGQMHGLVCLNRNGNILRPAIIWADRRSKSQVKEIETRLGRDRQADWLGNPMATGFMLPSWLWLAENEPGTVANTRHLLLPKDYIRYRLTGTLGAEPSDASSTLLFDPHQRDWCRPLLEMINLPGEYLPPVSESKDIAGGLLPEMARACGLLEGTPVVFGGSDVSLQALGQGLINPGQISCTIGTGGQLFAPLAQPKHDPNLRMHLFCHALPERWHLETAILSAGLALNWLKNQLWPDLTYAFLADAARNVEAASQGLFFLPYLVGERTPVMDPSIRAAFIGLGLEHGRPHVVRAVMEGVVFALRQGLDIIKEAGIVPQMIIATGASIKHPLWLQLQADIFNLPIQPGNTEQATGYGAAILAGKGTGVFDDYSIVANTRERDSEKIVFPKPSRVELYDRAFEQYIKIYPALKQV